MKSHKEEDDVYDYGYSLRNSLKRLEESEILSEGDKDIIREFLEHLRAKRVSTGRLAKYGFTIRRLTEHIGVPIRSATRKDIEKVSIWVQEQGYSRHTFRTPSSLSSTSTSLSAMETRTTKLPSPKE